MDKCVLQDCLKPKHDDSVQGYCEEHHLAHEKALREKYFYECPEGIVCIACGQWPHHPDCSGRVQEVE